jgi:crotonobetainyl-CoA:carnitine CoA-transferase CaiB-like acyl-CoA transferase
MTASQANETRMSDGPLSHIKVVDFSRFAAGPYCAKLLADYGADVIKVEEPEGDPARQVSARPDDEQAHELSPLFLYANTNKRGVTLDLNLASGREAFRRLMADADVLIEDRTPGEMDAWGLGYETLKAINQQLIVTSVTPFGQTGPYRSYRTHHLNLFHASGQGYLLPMNSTNLDRAPVKGAGFIGEFDAGTSAAIATLAAVFWRGAGGTGQHLDISKQHAVMHLEKSQLRRYVDDGRVSPNRTGKGRLLETIVKGKDGEYVVIIMSSQLQWKGLFEAMGQPAWGAAPPFDTQAGRSANYPELKQRLQAWADTLTAEEIFHKIQGARSACAPMYPAEKIAKSPQIEARDFLVEIDHPVAGRLKYPGRPYKLGEDDWRGGRPAPRLGEHNDEVLGASASAPRKTAGAV